MIKNKKEIVLILENIRSVHNVGSIFRTADGFGISKIYLTGFTPEPIDRFGRERNDFKKTSLGAEKTVLWEKVKTTREIIEKLKKDNFKIFSIEQAENSKPLKTLKVKNKTALILGSETEGVSPDTLNLSDKIFEIEMVGVKESFNVATTAGIAMYQITI